MALRTTNPASSPDAGSLTGLPGQSEWTTLFGGRLPLRQPTEGYRVNIDTLLLAAFAATRRRALGRAVDLGAGVGALGLCLTRLATVDRLDLVESNETLAALARDNLAASRVTGTVHVARIESAAMLPAGLAGTCDAVLCNPPFFAEGAAREATNAFARGSRIGELEPFLDAAARCLRKRGAAFFVYPAMALTELFAASARAQLVPKRLRLVHAFSDAPARIALLELKRARPGGLVVEPALVEWTAPGVRSDEVEALIQGEATGRT